MIDIKEIVEEQVISLAKNISLAAITAPKARGVDNLEIRIAYGKELEKLSEKLQELHKTTGQEFLLRDSNNVSTTALSSVRGTTRTPSPFANTTVTGIPFI